MAVVLPAPLAPRKPKISPLFTLKEMSVDGAEIAEGFDEMFHFDDRFVRGVVGRRVG